MPFFNFILTYLMDYIELILNQMKFIQPLLVKAHAPFH